MLPKEKQSPAAVLFCVDYTRCCPAGCSFTGRGPVPPFNEPVAQGVSEIAERHRRAASMQARERALWVRLTAD